MDRQTINLALLNTCNGTDSFIYFLRTYTSMAMEVELISFSLHGACPTRKLSLY